jgi:hypothetical protein
MKPVLRCEDFPSLENHWVLDIETTLDHNTVRLVGLRNRLRKNCTLFTDINDLKLHIGKMRGSTTPQVIWTWNGARFDIPILEELGVDFTGFIMVDGMHLAQMFDHACKRKGLEYWGQRLIGQGKTDLEIDYDNCSIADLAVYLRGDLELTDRVITMLQNDTKLMNKYTRKVLQLEFQVAKLVQEQVDKGVHFDTAAAIALEDKLTEKMEEYEREVVPQLPVRALPASKLDHPPKLQFRKDGKPSAALERWAGRNDSFITNTITGKYELVTSKGVHYKLPIDVPIKTHSQLCIEDQKGIKDWLLSEGWEPTEWNHNKTTKAKTSPRLTLKGSGDPCPNLSKLSSTGWVQYYQLWLVCRHRRNVLKSPNGTGWIPYATSNNSVLPSDADSMGANTGRFTHKVIANVPRPTSAWGEEMRSLFDARPGKVWVGWDASALEARVEAHYCWRFDKDYANELCNGDVHQRNLDRLPSLGTRTNAKTFKYAITYGASPAKLASTHGWSLSEATTIYHDFWEANPALSKLKKSIYHNWRANDKKFIRGLDFRPIATRSEHSLLNAKFQSAGAIVMKYAMLIANKRIRQEFSKEEAYGLIRYHDEEVWECDPLIATEVAQIGAESITQAGEYLGLRVPLKGESHIGVNWREVH